MPNIKHSTWSTEDCAQISSSLAVFNYGTNLTIRRSAFQTFQKFDGRTNPWSRTVV
jgi:hypothetical protein